MTSELQVFNYKDTVVRTVERDGEVWFVAKDVCDVLGLSNAREAISVLDDDEKMTVRNSDSHSGQRGGAQMLNIISESGMYALVFRSSKPEAKAFSKWVRSEVLPQIRRKGSYSLHCKTGLEQQYAELQACYRRLEEAYLKTTPVVDPSIYIPDGILFVPPIQLLDNGKPIENISVEDLANVITDSSKKLVTRNDLFAWLRNKGWLSTNEDTWNQPTQQAQDMGFFTTRRSVVIDPQTRRKTPYIQTRVTATGVQFFLNLVGQGETFNPHRITVIMQPADGNQKAGSSNA